MEDALSHYLCLALHCLSLPLSVAPLECSLCLQSYACALDAYGSEATAYLDAWCRAGTEALRALLG
eukprot:scaffold303867_cov18-Tisochrysis_lutea.AAC.1